MGEVSLMMIPVDAVRPNPDQPRQEFDPVEIESLAASIEAQGLIQPIVVLECQDGYTLVDGERRWRAMKRLGRAAIEAKVIEYGRQQEEVDLFLQAATANLQRSDLNPIEEGRTFQRMRDDYGMTLFEVARAAGRSIAHVGMRIKLLEFEDEIKELYGARRLPIDPKVIYGLFKLPMEIRAAMAKKYAMNGTSTTGINLSISRILNARERADVPLMGRRKAPAAIMSQATGASNKMLELAGGEEVTATWEMLERAAMETCEACDLHEMASAQMCKDCPAVELLKRLRRMVKETHTEEK